MAKPNTTVLEIEVTDYGIDHAQYFQGHGVSFTRYTHAYLGCGSNYKEALDDAIEQVAMEGEFDCEGIDEKIYTENELYGKDLESVNTDSYHEENENSEMYYYVGLRIKAETVLNLKIQ